MAPSQEGKIVIEDDNTKEKPAELNVGAVKVFSFVLMVRESSESEWIKQPSKEFDVPMYVTLDVPEGIDTSKGVEIFHIADGSNVWEALGDGILSEDGRKVSFVASSFSSYAIAAKAEPTPEDPTPTDPVEEPDDSEDEDEGDDSNEAEDVSQSNAPKTGDHMDGVAMIWVVVLAMAAAGVAVIVKRRRESE